MAIRIRRGTDAQRLTVVLQDGEIAWTTDTQEFFVGDGVTLGGIFIGPGAVGAFVPLTRNITINGITQDLSVDRTWTIAAGVTSVNTATGAVSLLVSNTGTGGTLQWNTTTLEIPEAAATKTGLLRSTDWSTFNNKVTSISAGTGISVGGTTTVPIVTNTAPDQTVVLTAGTGIGVAGVYPNFTISNTDPTSGVTLASAGGTETLVNDGTGPSLATKGLTAGSGVSLTGTATDITIANTDPGSAVTLTSAGGTETLVNDGIGPALATKGITAGTGISLSSSATALTVTNSAPDQTVVLTGGTGIGVTGTYPSFTITNSDPASGVTLTSAGGTESLVNDGTGPALANKGLTAGTGVSLSSTATDVTITNSDPGSGVTLTSAGGTQTLINDGTGPALATKGLTAGTGISLSSTATDVTVTNSAPDQVVALTAGTGIGITGAYPNFTITNSSPSSGGTVTSVGLALPTEFAISGSPVTGAGTLTGSWNAQSANAVLAGPTSGGAATPTFRALVSGDIPDISATYLTVANAALNYQPLDLDLTTIAGLTPANDDIIQRKAGAWTNRTIAQYYADLQPSVENDVYFTVPFIPAVLSPADGVTYYIGPGSIAPSTTATNQDISLPFDFTVIGAVIMASGNTASGTTENSTMSIRNTTTSTSSTMGTFQTNGSTTVIITTTLNGLSINVNASQSFCLQWLAPTWATNPNQVAVRTILICKRR